MPSKMLQTDTGQTQSLCSGAYGERNRFVVFLFLFFKKKQNKTCKIIANCKNTTQEKNNTHEAMSNREGLFWVGRSEKAFLR